METGTYLALIALAVVGGIAKHLTEFLKTRRFDGWRLLAQAVIGGFTGTIVISVVAQSAPTWLGLAVGIGGYMGSEALGFISNLAKNRVRAALGAPDNKDEEDNA